MTRALRLRCEAGSVRRADVIAWVPTAIAVVGSAVAWHDWVTTQDASFLLLAVGMQAIAGLVLAWLAARDRRLLVALVAMCVPVLGPIASLYIDRERGRGGTELLADVMPPTRRLTALEIAQRLTGALPPCDALVSGNAEARRATLAQLSERARTEDIAILRWARNQRDADVAVEAALALADLEQRFELRLRTARAAVASRPSYATHAAVVTAICDGVVSGIVDPPLVIKLASEARRHFLDANVADPETALALVVPCGRLELAARRPDLAFVLAKRALSRTSDPELIQLYAEAAYATRRFDLVPGLRSREADVRAA